MNIKTVSHKGVSFIYSSKLGQTEINYLRSNFEFSHLHLEDHINKTELPKIESTKKYILIVLGFPSIANGEVVRQEREEAGKNSTDTFKTLLNIPQKTLSHIPIPKFSSETKKERISAIYIDIYIGENYVAVLSDGVIPQINHIFEICQRTTRVREEFLGQGSGFLAYRIIDSLLDGYLPIVNAISGMIDKIDREMEKKQTPGTLEEMSVTRRNIVVLHTMIKTTIPIFRKLRDGIYRELNGNLFSYWANALNHSEGFLERLEDDRELIEGISESNEFLLRSKTNEIVMILTIFSGIVLPLTLIASIYGMNISLPLQKDSFAFAVIMAIMFVLGFSMVILFKRKRWF